jgi:hypothetical protein
MPYQGTSGTITAGTTIATEFAELTTITSWGVRISGIQANFDVNAFRDYYVNRFDVFFSDVSTPVTEIQPSYNGNGTWQQVAMDEYWSYGFEGQNEMLGTPPQFRDQDVKIPGRNGETVLTSKYSAINIAWEEVSPGALVAVIPAKGNVLIYLNLLDDSGSGILDTTTANTGETLAAALGITPNTLDE